MSGKTIFFLLFLTLINNIIFAVTPTDASQIDTLFNKIGTIQKLLEVNKCIIPRSNETPLLRSEEQICISYHDLFNIEGSDLFKERVQSMISNLSTIEVGRKLFNHLQKKMDNKKITIKESIKNSTDRKVVNISLDELDNVGPLETNQDNKVVVGTKQNDCLFFHELTHFYYPSRTSGILKDSFYTSTEELATITGDISIYCINNKKENAECKKKIYQFNENECRREMGLNPRYGHLGLANSQIPSTMSVVNKYYFGCSEVSPEMMRGLKDTLSESEYILALAKASVDNITKFKKDFGISNSDIIKICEFSITDKKFLGTKNSYYFFKLLENVDEETVNQCLKFFTKNDINKFLSQNEHYLFKINSFYNNIKNNPVKFQDILGESTLNGQIKILNELLKTDTDIEDFLKQKHSFNQLNNIFIGNPCKLLSRLNTSFINNPAIASTSMLRNLIYLSQICNNDEMMLFLDDDKKSINIDKKVETLCKLSSTSNLDKFKNNYISFYQKHKDYIYDIITSNKNNLLSKCLHFLQHVEDNITLTSTNITPLIFESTISNKVLINSIKKLSGEENNNFIQLITKKITDYTKALAKDDFFDGDKISSFIRNLLILNKAQSNENVTFITCDILEGLTHNIGDLSSDVTFSEDGNEGLQLIKYIISEKELTLNCSKQGGGITRRLLTLCKKLNADEDPCPVTDDEILQLETKTNGQKSS